MPESKPRSGGGGTSAVASNRLLSYLSADDLQLLQRHLTPVALPLRKDLEKPNRRIEDVYFPDAGIASVIAIQTAGTRVEVGLVGCEGMTGASVVLGADSSPHATYIQVAGQGQHIKTKNLQRAMNESKSLHGLLLRYVHSFMIQTAHTAISNAKATIEQRLARWLLMADDRINNSALPLTHEFLGLMLGVRRAGVTEALHDLADRGLIEANRGQIVLLNRRGVERVAADSYGSPEAEYRRLIGTDSYNRVA
jgi:CRP-like cAMP-binding protein